MIFTENLRKIILQVLGTLKFQRFHGGGDGNRTGFFLISDCFRLFHIVAISTFPAF